MTFNDIFNSFSTQALTNTDFDIFVIFTIIGTALLFSIYILLVYRNSTKSSFYSIEFAKTLVGMSVVTASIIIAMQGSLVVSLGMVGALSIVRFRNAVKSPVDLLFLFWSISTGIICGTGLFSIAIVTAVLMTVVLLGIDLLPFINSTYILTIDANETFTEDNLLKHIKPLAKNIKIRTRSVYNSRHEMLLELNTK